MEYNAALINHYANMSIICQGEELNDYNAFGDRYYYSLFHCAAFHYHKETCVTYTRMFLLFYSTIGIKIVLTPFYTV